MRRSGLGARGVLKQCKLELVGESRCFEGRQVVYKHRVERLRLHDALRGVPTAGREADTRTRALLAFGPDLHRRELQRQGWRPTLRSGARIALIIPDTSPRGVNIPGENEQMDVGTGAGFTSTRPSRRGPPTIECTTTCATSS